MATTDVLAIAQQHLAGVKRTGNENIMAFCPFHQNTETQAFSMSLSSGLWICFGCKRTGNLTKFLRDIGLNDGIIQAQYRYAIEEAANHRPPRQDPLRPYHATQDPLPESFLGLFDSCPNALLDEGFDIELLRSFDVGFDEKHMRITYPLRDLQGRLVGISGRTVVDDNPRYKVYDVEYKTWGLEQRDTKKGQLIWNAHRVYPGVFRQSNASVVLVEGFKACMWLAQMGVENVLALMGSYMSEPQQWMLERLGATVYVMMDNDKAGLEATGGREATSEQKAFRGIAERLSRSLSVKVVEYDDEKKQPSDLSANEVAEALEQAKEYSLWAIRGGNRWRLEKMTSSSRS